MLSLSLRRSQGGRQRMERQKLDRSREERVIVEAKEDDLALFEQIKSIARKNFLIQSPDDFDSTFSEKLRTLWDAKQNGHSSEMLNADAVRNDYDWLLTPPDTPLFPSLDDEPSTTNVVSKDSQRKNPKPLSRLAPIEKRYSSSPSRLRTASQKNSATPSRKLSPPRKKSPSKSSSSPNSKKYLGSNANALLSSTPIRDPSPRISTSPKAYRLVQDHSRCDSEYSQSRKLFPKRLVFAQKPDKVTIYPNGSLNSNPQTVAEHNTSLGASSLQHESTEIGEESSTVGEKLTIPTPEAEVINISEGFPLPFSQEKITCRESFSKFCEEGADSWLDCEGQEDLIMIKKSSDNARISRCNDMILDSRKFHGDNSYLNFKNIIHDREISSSSRSASPVDDLSSSPLFIKNESGYVFGLSKRSSKQEEFCSLDQIMAIISPSEDRNRHSSSPNNTPQKDNTELSALIGHDIADDLLKENVRDELASERIVLGRCLMNEIMHQAAAIALENQRKMAADSSTVEAPKTDPKCNCIIM